MWGIVIIGHPKSLDDFYRGVASLVIAYTSSKDVNAIINGEIPLGNKRFDHIALKTNVPLDLRKILSSYRRLIMIIEDSSSEKRLEERKRELSYADLIVENVEFLHIEPKEDRKLILSLRETSARFYKLEVGI